MKKNEIQVKRDAIMAEEIAADPDILRGKKITGTLLVIWLITRLLFLVMDLICAKIGFIKFAPPNIISFLLALLFAPLLFNGVKYLPALPLFGGVMMVVSSFREHYYSLLGLDLYPELKLYTFSYALTAWTQVAVMLCLLFLPLCVKYAAAADRTMKKLKNQPDGPRL